MNHTQSNKQYDAIISTCREEFFSKNGLYGQSWHRYRVMSLLEKIAIKLERVQNIQEIRVQKVEDSVKSEFPAIINYCILGLIKSQEWSTSKTVLNLSPEELTTLYNTNVQNVKDVFKKKNHDYNESWRKRSISFMVDEMLVKYDRADNVNKKISDKKEKEKEIREVFIDICNYAIFCKILIDEGHDPLN